MTSIQYLLGQYTSIKTSSFRKIFYDSATVFLILAMTLPVVVPMPVTAAPIDAETKVALGLISEISTLDKIRGIVRLLGNSFSLVSDKIAVERKKTARKSFGSRQGTVAQIVAPDLGGTVLKIGEARSLAAIPVDKSGSTVHGVKIEWSSSRPEVAAVGDQRLVARAAGKTLLTLTAGTFSKRYEVIVGTELEASGRSLMNEDLSEDQFRNQFTPQENLGTPPGQVEAQSSSRPAAFRGGLERPGSSSFGFSLPIESIPGRGLSTGIDITYNSRLWSLWTSPLGSGPPPKYWYNREGDWLAPGFKMTLGTLRRLDYYNYSLTSPNGTKHQLHYVSGDSNARTYESADGTFIRLNITATNGNVDDTAYVVYPDGSRYVYQKLDGYSSFFYPKKITDSNGNFINIEYKDSTGRILYIKDTLNRYTNFHYDSSNKLVTVTVPGFDGGAERQTIRFYYDTINFDTTTQRFTGAISNHNVPASATVLKYVYFPGNQSGYKYDYSAAWGMIYKVSSLRGMTVDSTSLSSTGSVTNGEQAEVAATTTYNYPLTLGSPLTEVPNYTTRTDDWLGRTTAQAPVTTYQVTVNTTAHRTESRITAPDGTIRESWAKISPYAWDDGLITDVFTKTPNPTVGEKTWSHTKTFWGNQSADPGRKNIRVDKIETTNDASQTKATVFNYDTYNNQTKIYEHDFAAPGSLGAELRRTEMSYETGSGWVSNRLVNLPKTVKTFIGTNLVSRTEYAYDGESLIDYGFTAIVQHDTAFNPGVTHRGNLTKVTSFADPTNDSDPDKTITTMKYDVVGNLIETGADCCKERSWEYTNSNYYAYPVSQNDGDAGQLETLFSYDLNTGLLTSSTDANVQTTEITYDPTTLRQTRVDLPNGSWTTTEFNDLTFPYHVKTTSSLDATRSVSSWSFANGIRQGFRSRSQTNGGYLSSDVEFDNMGRPAKSFNPYTVSALSDGRPGGIKFTSMTEFDGLGRVLEMTLADNTTVENEYSGLVATVMDQAGKKRRQIADTLGRIVRVDEPNANGDLGAVTTPNHPTYYEYDGNDNLTKVIQSDGTVTQERLFKYDGLSRLTHEKQVEANATLNDSGVHVGSGTWTGVYKYNTDNLLLEAFNAKGIKSTFTYDGLNRIESVVYTGESGYQTPTVTYTYDQTETTFFNKGRLTKVETAPNATYGTPATVQHYRYDKVGQVTKHTQSIGSESYLQEYSYNLAGQMISQKYPSGKVVNMSVDNFGRLSTVADAQRTYVSGLTFDNRGLLSQMNLGNGTHETFSYNDRFQMTSQSLMKGAEVLQKYDYGYGQTDVATGAVDATKNNGQLGKIESFIGSAKQASQRFAYDHLGRLKEAREHRGDNDSLTYKQVFDFDRFGNKYRKASSNPTTGQQNPLPFTPIEDSDISKSTNRFTAGTTYDDAGQVVNDAKFRDIGFAYDANGRQVKATKANQPDAWTVYDALGNRVATKINNIWQLMVYDAFGKLVAEYGVAAETLGGVKYLQQDWQGSIRTVSNSNGFVVARTDHQAFGEDVGVGVGLRKVEQGYSADKATRQGYGLTENDSATGLNHTWFRKLEQRAGRWTSPDPYQGSMQLSDPQSFNRYSYVSNQPTNFVDPSGLFALGFGFCYTSYRWVNDEQVAEITCSPGNTRAVGSAGGPGTSSSGRGGTKPQQGKSCSVDPLTPVTDPDAKRYDDGDRVNLNKLTQGTQAALSCFRNKINPSGVHAAAGGPSGATWLGPGSRVNSGYRPQAYNDHLQEVFDKWQQLKNNKQKECQELRAQVDKKFKDHQLGTSRPASGSNHIKGTAFDITIWGVTGAQIRKSASACGLAQGKGHGSGHHFNFIGQEP